MTELGVYAGPAATGVQGAQAFASSTGSPISRRADFLSYSSWAGLAGSIPYALDAHAAGPAMTLDLAVPLLVSTSKASGETLADVAAGAHDDIWQALADQLVTRTYRTALRLGWEFNGNWYPWSALTTPAVFADAYRRVWQIIERTAGEHVDFVWCVSNGRTSVCPQPDLAYPGDRYVDVIGVDFYDYSWVYGRDGTGKDVRDRAWGYLTTGDYSLDWWTAFAALHRKPFALCEWGPGIKTNGQAGGDNPDFVHRVLTACQLNDVAWATYFEAAGNGVDHLISTTDTKLPAAARAFRDRMSAWSLHPASTTLREVPA